MGTPVRLEVFVRRLAGGNRSERDAHTIAEACIEDMPENVVAREVLDSHKAVLVTRLKGIEDYLRTSIPNLDARIGRIFIPRHRGPDRDSSRRDRRVGSSAVPHCVLRRRLIRGRG